MEFASAGIPYRREVRLPIYYNGILLKKEYYADFVCYDKIILELKAVSELTKVHKSQVKNYLKASGYQLGILANFGNASLETARICNSNYLLYK